MAKKILVIEDEDNCYRMYKGVFCLPKYCLEITKDLDEAKTLIKQSEPTFDVAIVNPHLDEQLPAFEAGLELLGFIQNNYPTMARIVVTGKPEGPVFEKFREQFEVDELLIKASFRKEDLEGAVDKAINKRKSKNTQQQVGQPATIENTIISIGTFDVFLSYNSKDKPQVQQITAKLKERQLRCWIDTEQIAPGQFFQDRIQEVISKVKSAAIFIGLEGVGKWQKMELQTFISRCVDKDIPVIPVLLPGVEEIPEHLLFLKLPNRVQFKDIDDEDAFDNLVWGIKGKHPQRDA